MCSGVFEAYMITVLYYSLVNFPSELVKSLISDTRNDKIGIRVEFEHKHSLTGIEI